MISEEVWIFIFKAIGVLFGIIALAVVAFMAGGKDHFWAWFFLLPIGAVSAVAILAGVGKILNWAGTNSTAGMPAGSSGANAIATASAPISKR